MLKSIEINMGRWDWKTQLIWEWENQMNVSSLISKVERGYYKTRKVKININVYDLSNSSFHCPDLLEFLTHYKLVENANLDYPVIVNNQWIVIDGRHRICKAILLWKKSIKWIQIMDSSVI